MNALPEHSRSRSHWFASVKARSSFASWRARRRHLAGELGAKLETWTGARWMVSISDEEGEATLADQVRADAMRP